MIRISIWAVTLSFFMVTVFSGCRSMTPSVTYYTLSPMAQPSAETTATGGPAMVVGIRAVDLPGTINRTQMVTRSSPHQLEISSLHRWADYPNQLVQQTIGENLQALLPDARVVSAPWPMGLKPDVTVTFKFYELIGTTDNQVLLSAVWTITAADPALSGSHRLNLAEPITGKGYDALAAAHSRVLVALCRNVADTLKAFHG
jgi:uncharacterized lipoprotein YmbA